MSNATDQKYELLTRLATDVNAVVQEFIDIHGHLDIGDINTQLSREHNGEYTTPIMAFTWIETGADKRSTFSKQSQ